MFLSFICWKPTGEPSVFLFLCDFLAAISPSAVHLYGDDGEITASASKWDSPFYLYVNLPKNVNSNSFKLPKEKNGIKLEIFREYWYN